MILLSKSIIVPCIFVYYLIENNYKFDLSKVLILLLCFAGDVIILLDLKFSFIYSVYAFFMVYLLLFKFVLQDSKTINFIKKDFISISIVSFLLIFLLISILNLKFQKDVSNDRIFIIYGITLFFLSVISISNYISKGSSAVFYCALMITCFLLSDVFYVLNHFYFKLPVFEIITLSSQVLSYFFMVSYFLEKDKKVLLAKQL
jgi:hypothetical protein